jgi:ankyrin repeat protein
MRSSLQFSEQIFNSVKMLTNSQVKYYFFKVNSRDDQGNTALHYAARNSDVEVVQELLQRSHLTIRYFDFVFDSVLQGPFVRFRIIN